MLKIDLLIAGLSQFSYLTIFLVIVASGFGLPFPEEIVLLLSGYFASLEILELDIAIIVCFVSLVIADNIGFYLGRKGSKIVNKILKSGRIDKYKHLVCKKRTIFLTRFLSGIRVFFPIGAGAAGMHWRHFFIADTAAVAILSVGLNLLGYHFGKNIGWLIKTTLSYEKIVAIIAVSVLVLMIVFLFVFKKKKSTVKHKKH